MNTSNIINLIFDKISYFCDLALFFNITPFFSNIKLPFIITWVIFGGIYFTVKFNFINIKMLPLMMKSFFFKSNDSKFFSIKNIKNVAHPRKLVLTAIGESVDVSAIFGVAMGIIIGGVGSIFWIIIGGFLSMSTRFVEVCIAHMTREKSNDEGYIGGPQIYIPKIFRLYKMRTFGKVISTLFCISIIVSTFFSLQINQIVSVTTLTFEPLANSRLALSFIISVVVLGIAISGFKVIINFCSRVVKVMSILYLSCCIYVIAKNFTEILPAIELILVDAFSFKAINGGILGCAIMGMQRIMFCNDSGQGVSSITHVNSANMNSMSEGIISMVGPIMNTFIMAFCSGLVVVMSGLYQDGLTGTEIFLNIFQSIHPKMNIMLVLIVIMFGLTTCVAWAYFGSRAWVYLFPRTKFVYYILLFGFYLSCGTIENFGIILNLADAFNFSTALWNMTAIYLGANILKSRQKNKWFDRKRR